MPNNVNKKTALLKKKAYIKASAKYFEKYGYEEANMTKLAKELGVSVGTLYKIFENKENLFFEYILYQIDYFSDILIKKQTDNSIDNLKLYLKYKYKYFTTNKKSIELSLGHEPFFFHKLNKHKQHPMKKIFNFLAIQFKDILKNDEIDYNHIAILFKKVSDGYIESHKMKEFDTTNAIDNTINLFLNGILSANK